MNKKRNAMMEIRYSTDLNEIYQYPFLPDHLKEMAHEYESLIAGWCYDFDMPMSVIIYGIENESVAHLIYFATTPDFQMFGYQSALQADAESILSRNGIKKLTASVCKDKVLSEELLGPQGQEEILEYYGFQFTKESDIIHTLYSLDRFQNVKNMDTKKIMNGLHVDDVKGAYLRATENSHTVAEIQLYPSILCDMKIKDFKFEKGRNQDLGRLFLYYLKTRPVNWQDSRFLISYDRSLTEQFNHLFGDPIETIHFDRYEKNISSL